jgi:hypothetical protein
MLQQPPSDTAAAGARPHVERVDVAVARIVGVVAEAHPAKYRPIRRLGEDGLLGRRGHRQQPVGDLGLVERCDHVVVDDARVASLPGRDEHGCQLGGVRVDGGA